MGRRGSLFFRDKIEAIRERVEKVMGPGNIGSVLVHAVTHSIGREGTTAIVKKYRQLFRTSKQARVEQITHSGI